MQEIIKQLNDLILLCQARVQKADDEKQRAVAQTAIAESQQERNKSKEDELIQREEKCREIEALGLSYESLQTKHSQIDGQRHMLLTEKTHQDDLFKVREQKIQEGVSRNELIAKKLQEQQIQLDRDRSTFREDVMKEIHRNLGMNYPAGSK